MSRLDREERLQMRQRGAASRKTKEVDFGFAFGLGAQQQPQQQQQELQQEQQHAPESPIPDPQTNQRTPRSARNALPERPSMFDIPPDDDEDASPLRSIKRRKTDTPSRISRTPSRSGSRPASQPDVSVAQPRNGQLNGDVPPPQDARPVSQQPPQQPPQPQPPQLPKTVPPPSRTKSPSPDKTRRPDSQPETVEVPQQIPDANDRIQESTVDPVQIQASTSLQGGNGKQTIPKEPSPPPELDIPEPSPQLQPEPDIQAELQPDIEEQIELSQLDEPAEELEQLQLEPDIQTETLQPDEPPELPEPAEPAEPAEEPEQPAEQPESPKPQDTKGKRKRQQAESPPETTGRPQQSQEHIQEHVQDHVETPREPLSRQDKGKEPDRAADLPVSAPTAPSQGSQPKAKRGRPRKSTDTHGPEPSRTTDRQTKRRGRPSKGRRPTSTPEEPEPEEEEAESSEEDQPQTRNRPGETVPVTIHRLANISSLQNINTQTYNSDSSDSADELSTRQRTKAKHPHRGGVNQADVLSQICRETLEKTLTTLKTGIANETNAARRAEWTRKKKAVEAFGTELDGRLFEMSEMLDSNFVLGVKLRRAKREMLEMRSRLYHVRREREDVAVQMDDVRRRFAEEERVRISRANINNTLHSLELAVDSAREQESSTSGLEYLVRSVAEEVSSRGGGGLLDQIKAFNAELELI